MPDKIDDLPLFVAITRHINHSPKATASNIIDQPQFCSHMNLYIKKKIHNLLSDKKFSEILTGSAWALGARVLATLIGMVSSIIVARAYGAEMLGVVAVLNSFLMLATIFTVLGTNTSILRLIPEHIAKYSPTSAFKVYRKTQYFVAAVSVFTGTLLFFGSGFIAETVFSKPHLRFYFSLGSVFIIYQALMIFNTQAVRGLRLIRMFAFMQILPSLSKLIILILITIFFYQQSNPVYATYIAISITAVFGAWIMDKAFKKRITSNDTLQSVSVKEILSISLPMLMTSTMSLILSQTGIIVLGSLQSEAEVGYYAVVLNLSTLTSFVLAAINAIVAPKFSELYSKGLLNDLFYLAKKSTKLIFWLTTPILIILLLSGKYILSYMYGHEFESAYSPMSILIIGQFFNSISGSTGYFMNMTDHQNQFRNIVFGVTLINVAMNILLIPMIGIYGAAITSTVSVIAWNSLTLCYMKIKFKKTTFYFPFVK